MTKKKSHFVLAISLLLATGCASQAAADRPSTPMKAESMMAGPTTQAVVLPQSPGAGQGKEVKILVDEPGLKLATIVLRQGTVLPEHATPVAATILALAGAGTLIADGKRIRLDRGNAIVLAADVAHSIEPDAGTDMLLLVHHLGNVTEAHHQ